MSAKSRWKAASFLVSAAFAIAGAGCGSNPPCQTDIATVDAARSAAKSAEAKLEEAKQHQADLQRQIQAEQARQKDLEQRKAELEAKISELGG
jgi:uncharacterized protein YdaU (DUF1376 family)